MEELRTTEEMGIEELYDNYNDLEYISEQSYIQDVGMLNWAIQKCIEENERLDFYEQSVKAEIDKLKIQLVDEKSKSKARNSWLLRQVDLYIAEHKIPTKKTKTQEVLKSATGTFVKKLPKLSIATKSSKQAEDNDLIKYCVMNNLTDYINKTTTAKWGEFKKLLAIANKDENIDVVDKETGEINVVEIHKGDVYLKETGEVLDFFHTEESVTELEVKTNEVKEKA